jgi:hypothetical protein
VLCLEVTIDFRDLVSELSEQHPQLIETTVDIADDIEWPMLVLAIVPERLPLDDDGINLFRC